MPEQDTAKSSRRTVALVRFMGYIDTCPNWEMIGGKLCQS